MSKLPVIAIIVLTAISVRAQSGDAYAEAIARLRQAPGDARLFEEARAAGFDAIGRGLHGRALEVFDAALVVRRDDALVLYGRALALFNLRRTDDAMAAANLAVDRAVAGIESEGGRRNAANALTLRAVIEAVGGRTADSVTDLRRAIGYDPENFDAHFSLGRALYGMRDMGAAARSFEEAVRLRPADVGARFFLATSLERNGELDAALASYRELVRLAPGRAEGHLGVGALLVRRGGKDEVEGAASLSRAIELNGELYEARIALGRTLVRQGRAEEAVEHLKAAARLSPENPEPHYQLAMAYRKLGRRAESAAEFREVQRINDERRKKGKVGSMSDPQ